jgi:hypothetical protein
MLLYKKFVACSLKMIVIFNFLFAKFQRQRATKPYTSINEGLTNENIFHLNSIIIPTKIRLIIIKFEPLFQL